MSKVVKKNKIRRSLILNILSEEKQLSLSQISRKTGLALPLVTKIISSLKDEKYVVDVEGVELTHAGRPPSVVKLNGDAGFLLGIDLGRAYSNFIILNLEQKIINFKREKVTFLANDKEIINRLKEAIDKFLSDSGVEWGKILGAGISIPGLLNREEGRTYKYLNFDTEPLKETLKKIFKTTIFIENDVKAMAHGELSFGAAKEATNALCLNVGWGLGLSIIIDGKVYYGSDNFAGEFGHIQVMPDGPLCQCGKRGCLETVASGRAIAEIAKEKLKNGEKSIITNVPSFNIDNIDATTIFKAANEGDQFSIEIIEEASKHLGMGIAMLINILNPDTIILNGGISIANPYLIDSIRNAAMKNSLVPLNKNVNFVVSTLGNKAGALGMATLVLKNLFEEEHLDPIAYV